MNVLREWFSSVGGRTDYTWNLGVMLGTPHLWFGRICPCSHPCIMTPRRLFSNQAAYESHPLSVKTGCMLSRLCGMVTPPVMLGKVPQSGVRVSKGKSTTFPRQVREITLCEGIKHRPPAKANLAGGLCFILLPPLPVTPLYASQCGVGGSPGAIPHHPRLQGYAG